MNINEIAELAGVSRATVSRYLNDGYVSEEKRAAIRKVIEDTGYRPSQQARNLRSKVTKLVGVIIPEIESGSVSQMVSGISEVLSVKDYQLLLADTRNNTRAELKYLRIFEKNQVDGIIFMGTMLSREHLYLMEEVEVPIVVTAQEIRQYSCVFQDDYHAAYDADEKRQTQRLYRRAGKRQSGRKSTKERISGCNGRCRHQDGQILYV